MKVVVEDFFKLPLEQKMIYAQLPNDLEGYGQAFVISEDQKLDWGGLLFLYSLPTSQRNMRFWPNNPKSFRYTKIVRHINRDANSLKAILVLQVLILFPFPFPISQL